MPIYIKVNSWAYRVQTPTFLLGHKVTKQIILEALSRLPHKENWIPKIKDISKSLGLKNRRVSTILKGLWESGDLLKIGNRYQFNYECLKTTKKQKVLILNYLLSWILFAIGLFSSLISAYFTSFFLATSMEKVLAWLLPIIMELFASIVFILIALIVSGNLIKSKFKILLVFILFLLWVLSASYSVITTIAGQFHKFQNKNVESIEINNKNIVDQNLIQLEQETRRELIKSRDLAIDRLNSLLKTADIVREDPSKVTDSWTTIQSRIYSTQKMIEELEIKINNSRENEKKLIIQNPMANVKTKKEITFFSWIASIFNGNEDTIQFGMSIFPAIFLDIISPIFLTLFVFFRKKYV